jgi:hypothetical protein
MLKKLLCCACVLAVCLIAVNGLQLNTLSAAGTGIVSDIAISKNVASVCGTQQCVFVKWGAVVPAGITVTSYQVKADFVYPRGEGGSITQTAPGGSSGTMIFHVVDAVSCTVTITPVVTAAPSTQSKTF